MSNVLKTDRTKSQMCPNLAHCDNMRPTQTSLNLLVDELNVEAGVTGDFQTNHETLRHVAIATRELGVLLERVVVGGQTLGVLVIPKVDLWRNMQKNFRDLFPN